MRLLALVTHTICLFLSGAVALTTGFTNGVGRIWLDNVQCRGTETRLIRCPSNNVGSHNCIHTEDVGVRCQAGEITCTEKEIAMLLASFAHL
jgi:hypothetical protein